MKKTIVKLLALLMIATYLLPTCTYADSWGDWSGWSTTAVEGSDTRQVEKKIQYRKATRSASWQKASSGNIDYAASWTAGFNKNHSLYSKYNKTPKKASETSSQKVTVSTSTIGYIYYHWCRGAKLEKAYNRYISSNKTGTYATFHAFYSTKDIGLTVSANARKCDKYSTVCKDTYWWLKERITIKRCAWVSYNKVFSSWGSWSSWQDSKYTSNDTTKVETRTVYRYRNRISDPVVDPPTENTSDKTPDPVVPAKESTTEKKAEKKKKPGLNKKGKITSLKSTKAKTVTMKWKKVTGISGYQCYFSLKKNFKSHTIQRFYGKKKTKVTITNFPAKKTYYAKIRPYKKVKGKKVYGIWSPVKKVKIK